MNPVTQQTKRLYLIALITFGGGVAFVLLGYFSIGSALASAAIGLALLTAEANGHLTSFGRRKSKGPSIPDARLADGIQLGWDGHFWAGETVLPAWAGFQERLGIYASESADEPSSGKVQISVRSITDQADTISPPSKEQELAFCFLRDHGELLRDKVIRSIFDEYPSMREDFAEFLGEELETMMPKLRDPSELKRLIGLSTIHISDVAKDGVAYVGFEFGCNWEEEHGLGVMTHKDRIVEVGDAETSFDAWRLRRGEIG